MRIWVIEFWFELAAFPSVDGRLVYTRPNSRQAAESALALWVAMKDSVSQMYDNRGLAEFWGPDV